MIHQSGKKKLNKKPAHRKSLVRNQAIHFIKYGCLQTTKPRVKEVQRLIEKVVTISRNGSDFNAVRKATSILPYDSNAIKKMFRDIAPKYKDRPGGYTRVIPMGRRGSDTAPISRLEWV